MALNHGDYVKVGDSIFVVCVIGSLLDSFLLSKRAYFKGDIMAWAAESPIHQIDTNCQEIKNGMIFEVIHEGVPCPMKAIVTESIVKFKFTDNNPYLSSWD